MLKKVMTLICFCCYLCFMQIGFAQDIIKQETPQKHTLKVAILPTLSSSQRYPDVNQLLYNNLTQEMHVPLNDTLQAVEYIDENSIYAAIKQSNFTYNQNLDTLKDTADLLDADVVVGYTIPTMYQHYYHSISRLDGSPLLNSYISVNLWVYYRPLNKTFKISDRRQYFDEISTWGMLTELAKDASSNLNKKAELKSLLKQSIKIKKGEL